MNSDVIAHHINSAYAANSQGKFEEAVRLCTNAIQLAPYVAAAWYNLGVAQRGLGSVDAATKSLKQAAQLSMDSAEAQTAIGLEFVELRGFQHAEKCLCRAIQLQRDYAPPYVNLGILRRQQGRLNEAESLFRKAVELNPDLPQAHVNLGAILNLLYQPKAAADSCHRAIQLDPNLGEAWNNLSTSLRCLKRYSEAVEAGYRAIQLSPMNTNALYNYGVALMDVGRRRDAAEVYKKALAIKPDFLAAQWALVMSFLPFVQEEDESLEEGRAAFGEGLAAIDRKLEGNYPLDEAVEVVGSLRPFYLAYQERNNRDLLAAYGRICAKVMERWQKSTKLKASKPSRNGPVRVGIVSSFFRQHSVWDAIVYGWLTHLDKSRFNLTCFSLDPRGDEETLFAKAQSDTFIENRHSLLSWAKAITEQSIDVLIYPEIGMDPLSTQLASMRLAPVQVASWGHPETTGLPTIDYYLSAEDFEPDDSSSYYTEKLVKLPHLGCSYRKYAVQSTVVDLSRYGISLDRPLLLSPGYTPKYSVRYDEVLVDVAKAIPEGQLIFFSKEEGPSNLLHERIRAAFRDSGLEPEEHIRILPWLDKQSFFGLLKQATVYLDTIGFSGFNTALQAIECGLPVVSREGRYLRGRLACGILKRLELAELIAKTDYDYVALARKIVMDGDYRSRIQKKIHERRDAILNDPLPNLALEQFLLDVSGRN